MNPFASQVLAGTVTEEFATSVEKFWLRKSRILFLVDGRLEVLTDPPATIGMEIITSSSAFGIAVAIGVLKGFSCGFSSFEVVVATRDGDGSPLPGHDITGFRFTPETLSRFDQVWMFGYLPGNLKPNSLDPADDSIIENPAANPLSDEELAALSRWMDAGGGVFAAGDHHVLGASMCHKVPRVSTMRAWTIADPVTTMENPTRHETTRPRTVDQQLGTAGIGEFNEMDILPQRIEWVPVEYDPVFTVRRPHPILCHPTLGPIDILPDHMHEGRCFDFSSSAWQTTRREASFDFAGYSNKHYPRAGTLRPLPQVIAWGTTLASPPLSFFAGPQDRRRFPQIAAYDGQEVGIGRVVVDSTWHHWFDMNLKGLMDAAATTGDRTHVDKIFRYYVNVGIYLASPGWRAGMLIGWLKAEQFKYFGREGVDLSADLITIGRAAIGFWQSTLGLCWVSDIADGLLANQSFSPRIREALNAAAGRCGMSRRLIDEAVAGAIVRTAYSDMEELYEQIAQKGRVTSTPLFKGLDEAVARSAVEGLKEAIKLQSAELHAALEQSELLGEAVGGDKAAP